MIKIETIRNGWTVEDSLGQKEAFLNIQDLFNYLLLALEGKSESFGGESYGGVRVMLGKSK